MNGPTNTLRLTIAILLAALAAAATAAEPAVAQACAPENLELSWDASANDGEHDQARSLVVTGAGRIYATGSFASGGASSCFVDRYEADGTPFWRQGFPGFDCGVIRRDGQGNLLVAHDTSSGPAVTKIDAFANVQWTTVEPTEPGSAKFYDLAVLPGGHSLAAGVVTESGEARAFLARYDVSGVKQWDYVHPNKDSELEAIAIDASGQAHVTGHEGGYAMTMKFDPQGTLLWTRVQTELGAIFGRDIVLDAAGHAYVAIGNGEALVAKYDPQGALLWLETLATPESDRPRGIAVDGAGNAYVVASGELGDFNAAPLRVAKYAPAGGAAQWVTVYDLDEVDEQATGIAFSAAGVVRAGLTIGAGPLDEPRQSVVLGLCPGTGKVLSDEAYGVVRSTGRGLALGPLGYPNVAGNTNDAQGSAAGQASLVLRYGAKTLDLWELDIFFVDGPAFVHPGDPVERTFGNDARDWLSFHARRGQSYDIAAEVDGARLPSVQVDLFAPDGVTQIAAGEVVAGEAAGTRTELAWTASEPGTYHLRFSPSDGSSGPERGYGIELSGDVGASALISAILESEAGPRLHGVEQLKDGRLILAGEIRGPDGTKDALAIKRDLEDGAIWQRAYGEVQVDVARDAVEGRDGQVLLGVERREDAADRDLVLMRLDGATGEPLAEKQLLESGDERLFDLEAAQGEGGLLIAASTRSLGGPDDDPLLMRIDENDRVEWALLMDTDEDDAALAAKRTREGGFLVLVGAGPEAGHTVAKLAGGGTLVWARRYESAAGDLSLSALLPTYDGGFAVAGTLAGGASGETTPLVAKLGAAGTPIWSTRLAASGDHHARSLAEAADGGIAVAGRAPGSDGFSRGSIVKLDETGQLAWQRGYEESAAGSELSRLVGTEAGAFAALGAVRLAEPDPQPWLLALDAQGEHAPDCGGPGDPGFVAEAAPLSGRVREFLAREVSLELVSRELLVRDAEVGERRLCDLFDPTEVSPPGAEPLLFADETTLAWEDAGDAETFTLFRGDVQRLSGGSYGSCLQDQLAANTAEDEERPALGEAFTYLVAGVNQLGPGPLGSDSSGAARSFPDAPCPD